MLQAAEREQYDVAALLVASNPNLANARDNRNLLAIDLIKNLEANDKWSVLLKN